MQKRGVMTGLVPRIKHGTKLVGRAVTVKTADGDWAKPVEAIDRARAGDVIVIDVGGGPTAVWGELASNSCLVKGVAGVVIDGAVRDLDTILELNFPCFSRHVAPHAGEPKGLGEIGSEIECGGQKVHTRSDVIVIDVGGGPTAVWGELASNSCLVKGVAGVVIDGAVRDLDTILELNFPCFSRHVAPHAGEPKGLGEIGSEIECGGQKVHT